MKELLSLGIKEFLKGVSSGKYIADGLFKSAPGVDFFRTPDTYGLITNGYAKTNKTGTTIQDEIRYFAKSQSAFYAYGDEGYLYSITSAGVPTVLDPGGEGVELDIDGITVLDPGRAGGRGLALYNDEGNSTKLFYFSNISIGRYNPADGTADNDYKTGLTNSEHSAIEFNGKLYFTNASNIGVLDGTDLTLDVLTLPAGFTARDIKIWNNYLAIVASNYEAGYSKLFLWDTYSAGYNFEYVIPEICTALQNYKSTLATFGTNVRLFNGGVFDVIYELNSGTTVRPGSTCYNNNTLYWKDWDKMVAYGSPIASIKALIYTPLVIKNDDNQQGGSATGAIINLDSDTNQFLVSTSEDKLYIYNSSYQGGTIRTIDFYIGHAKPNKMVVSFDTNATSASPIGVYFKVYGDKGLMTQETTKYLDNGNLHIEIPIGSYATDFVSLSVALPDGVYLAYKHISLYGTRSEQPTN